MLVFVIQLQLAPEDYKAMVDADTFPPIVEIECGGGVIRVLQSIDERASLFVELEPDALGHIRTQAAKDSYCCWMMPSCSWARVVVCSMLRLGCAWFPAAAGPPKDLADADGDYDGDAVGDAPEGGDDGAEDGAEDRADDGASLAGSGANGGDEGAEDVAEGGDEGADGGAEDSNDGDASSVEVGADSASSSATPSKSPGIYWLSKNSTYVARRRKAESGWDYKRFRPTGAGNDALRAAHDSARAWQALSARGSAAAAEAAAAGA